MKYFISLFGILFTIHAHSAFVPADASYVCTGAAKTIYIDANGPLALSKSLLEVHLQADSTILYSEASRESRPLFALPAKSYITLLAIDPETSWIKVRLDDKIEAAYIEAVRCTNSVRQSLQLSYASGSIDAQPLLTEEYQTALEALKTSPNPLLRIVISPAALVDGDTKKIMMKHKATEIAYSRALELASSIQQNVKNIQITIVLPQPALVSPTPDNLPPNAARIDIF